MTVTLVILLNLFSKKSEKCLTWQLVSIEIFLKVFALGIEKTVKQKLKRFFFKSIICKIFVNYLLPLVFYFSHISSTSLSVICFHHQKGFVKIKKEL